MHLEYQGIVLKLDFRPGAGCNNRITTGHGIYAEVHWPTRSLRIGESQNVRARNRQHIAWANKHRAGTHSFKEAARQGTIVDLAKQWGSEGLEHYLISNDPRLFDRELRVACEIFLHSWALTQTEYRNLNTQRGYRTVH